MRFNLNCVFMYCNYHHLLGIVCVYLTRLARASTCTDTRFPCLQYYKHERQTNTLTQLCHNQTTLRANYPLCCIIYHRAAEETSDWESVCVCVFVWDMCVCKCTVCSTFMWKPNSQNSRLIDLNCKYRNSHNYINVLWRYWWSVKVTL